MPKRIESAFLQSQFAKDGFKLPSNAILGARRTCGGLEYSAGHTPVKVLLQHLSKREFDAHDTVTLFGFDCDFLTTPNAAPDEYLTC